MAECRSVVERLVCWCLVGGRLAVHKQAESGLQTVNLTALLMAQIVCYRCLCGCSVQWLITRALCQIKVGLRS